MVFDWRFPLTLCSQHWLPARQLVLEMLRSRTSHPADLQQQLSSVGLQLDDRTLIMKNWFDYKPHLYSIEEELIASGEMDPDRRPLFILYPNWRVLAISINPQSFICRLALLEPWRGHRDGQLQQVSGVADAGFCHASGFTGGAASLFGVAQMAALTIQHHDSEQRVKRLRLDESSSANA